MRIRRNCPARFCGCNRPLDCFEGYYETQDLSPLGVKRCPVQILGPLRELEVAIKDARKYKCELHGTTKMKRKARKRICKQLTIQIPKLVKTFMALDEIRKNGRLSRSRLKRLCAGVQFSAREHLAKADLHRLRIAIKKVRYLLEALEEPVVEIKQLQTLLGRIHDLENLMKICGANSQVKRDIGRMRREVLRIGPAVARSSASRLTDRISEIAPRHLAQIVLP